MLIKKITIVFLYHPSLVATSFHPNVSSNRAFISFFQKILVLSLVYCVQEDTELYGRTDCQIGIQRDPLSSKKKKKDHFQSQRGKLGLENT